MDQNDIDNNIGYITNITWTDPNIWNSVINTHKCYTPGNNVQDNILNAIEDHIVVHNSSIDDGTVYLQVNGPDGKIYNVMIVIEQD